MAAALATLQHIFSAVTRLGRQICFFGSLDGCFFGATFFISG
jgi:hypothetical protein